MRKSVLSSASATKKSVKDCLSFFRFNEGANGIWHQGASSNIHLLDRTVFFFQTRPGKTTHRKQSLRIRLGRWQFSKVHDTWWLQVKGDFPSLIILLVFFNIWMYSKIQIFSSFMIWRVWTPSCMVSFYAGQPTTTTQLFSMVNKRAFRQLTMIYSEDFPTFEIYILWDWKLRMRNSLLYCQFMTHPL